MASAASLDDKDTAIRMPFTEVYSNNMSLKREVYFKTGMMQGLDFPGSSMWCDLDFGYRAHRQGFEVFRSTKAICWHRDYTVRNLETYTKRMRIAGYRAVILFHKYPELLAHVPMFADKTPILWGQDSPGLIVRKLTRVVASSRLALWIMEKVVHALEKHPSTSHLLQSLYRFIVGGYIFQGYRQGLNEFTRMNNVGDPSTLP
jgi:GT2 family glycosyltransferase